MTAEHNSDPNPTEAQSQGPSEDHKHRETSESKSLLKWQKGLLPFLKHILIIFTIFFLIASVFHLYQIQNNVLANREVSLDEELKYFQTSNSEIEQNNFEKAKWATLVKLEANTIEKRYHQANAILLTRVWSIYLGFLTGMIIALVGAAFILGKLQESQTAMDFGAAEVKTAIKSSSPGLILCLLGSILMAITILGQVTIHVEDRPLYVSGVEFMTTQTEGNDDSSSKLPGNVSISIPDKPSNNASDEALEIIRQARAKRANSNSVNK